MNNEENNKELVPRATDKENRAHSKEEKNFTTNEKNQPTDQNKPSELETQQSRETSTEETFQQGEISTSRQSK